MGDPWQPDADPPGAEAPALPGAPPVQAPPLGPFVPAPRRAPTLALLKSLALFLAMLGMCLIARVLVVSEIVARATAFKVNQRLRDANEFLVALETYMYRDRYGPTNEKLAEYTRQQFPEIHWDRVE